MKYLAFFVFLICVSCSNPETQVNFSVDISNTEVDEVKVTGFNYEKIMPLEDGKLSDTLHIENEGLYSVRIGRNRTNVYLAKGAKIGISVDGDDFEQSLNISNTNQSIQDYELTKSKAKKALFGREIFDLEPEDFLSKIGENKDSLQRILTSASLDESYVATEKENFAFNEKRLKFIYPAYSGNDISELPPSFQDVISASELKDEQKYLSSLDYKNLVDNHFKINMYNDTIGSYEEILMRHIKELPSGNIKNQLLYGDIQYALGPNEKMDDMYAFFKENSTNSKHRTLIEEKYNELLKLKAGEISPKFDYENYNGGTTSLDDLAGKYVYIDVWATWCGPCIGEIPSLKKVEKAYHGKNIEFVSISIDNKEDYDKWRKMIESKELGGQQLIAENAWQSTFAKEYKINGIPRFILIDPEGKIVSADAPRPSDDALVQKFDALKI